MLFHSRGMGSITIYTPEEIRQTRLAAINKQAADPNSKQEAPHEILEKLSQIVAVYGFDMLDYALRICWDVTSHAMVTHNFKRGSLISFSTHVPDWFVQKIERLTPLMDYVQEILTILGWTVTWPDPKELVLRFHPDSQFTPNEVDQEIQRSVDRFAGNSVYKILELAFENQFMFTKKEIGLEKIPPGLFHLVIAKIGDLLGPGWLFEERSGSYHLLAR